jgi:protein subunit release factor B
MSSPSRKRGGPQGQEGLEGRRHELRRQAGLREEDLEESFIRSSGKGGQNVNKVATCVVLVHRPSGLSVKCQRARSQGENRELARDLLAAKIVAMKAKALALREAAVEKVRRQKRTRPPRLKRAILAAKRERAETKLSRKPVRRDD